MQGFKQPLWGNTYREEYRHDRSKRGDEWIKYRTYHCTLCFRHGFSDRMQHELEFDHNSHKAGVRARDPLGVMLEIVDCLWGDVIKSS